MAEQITAIQKFSNDDQRLALLVSYNPSEHLLKWQAYDKNQKKNVIVNYYPASWRLYELRLRYPTAKFDINIILMDQERNFCIVQARLYVGPTYEEAEIRSIAHKQGFLTELDRVETKAKARAARDLGISTELALDMDDVPEGEPIQETTVEVMPPQITKPVLANDIKARLNNLFERAMVLRLLKVGNAKNFLMWASSLLGKAITSAGALSADDMDLIEQFIKSEEEAQQKAS